MKIHLLPKYRVQFLFLILVSGINASLFSQSNPAEIFSGQVFTGEKDTTSNYWLGNTRYVIKSISVGHDNDLFGIATRSINKDESYTGGFQLQVTMSPLLEQLFFRFQLNDENGKKRPTYPIVDSLGTMYINNVSKFELGAQAYTPFDLESSEVVEEDRPYGSFTYLSFGLNSTLLRQKNRSLPSWNSKKVESIQNRRDTRMVKFLDRRNKKFSRIEDRLLKKKGDINDNSSETKITRINERLRVIGENKNIIPASDSIRLSHRIVDSQIFVGTVGGQAIPTFQSWSHRGLIRATPNGWHNQIGGGQRRLVINYRVSQRFLWMQTRIIPRLVWSRRYGDRLRTTINASVHVLTDLNLGSYATNIATGLRLHLFEINRGARLNLNRPQEQNIDKDQIINIKSYSQKQNLKDVREEVDAKILKKPKLADRFNLYFYGQVLGRAIVFDSMLQGTLFNDQSIHTIDYRQLNPFRLDISVGLAIGFTRKISLYVDGDFRSREFLGGKKWHVFSRIGMNFKFQ